MTTRYEPTATAEEIAFAKALEADVEPLIATIVALGDKSTEAGRALLLAAIALCEIARRETHDDAFMEIFVGKALAAGQDINYEGASGPCDFTERGDIEGCKFRFEQVRAGKITLLSVS